LTFDDTLLRLFKCLRDADVLYVDGDFLLGCPTVDVLEDR
jgi:hypothetical protein